MYNEENELNEVADTEVTENTQESTTEESASEPIPDELDGVDESVAREIMAEANADSGEDVQEEKQEDTHTDNSSDDDGILPNTNVPYTRFKQKVTQVHKLEDELNTLKAKLASTEQNTEQTAVQQNNANQMNVRVPQQNEEVKQNPMVNADVAKQFKNAVTLEAMRMTGMTQDDVEATEYMDSDDERLQTWNTAYKLAEARVTQHIQEAQSRHIAQQQHIVAMHNESVLRYNQFANEMMQDSDFPAIQDYAINDYFSKQDKADQAIIAGAYSRIEGNVASPQDTMIVRKYVMDAKNDYLRTHGKSNNSNSKNTANKIKQGRALPRSSNINGAGNDTGDVSVETLERMLNTTPFEDIPEKYQRMLLGMEPIE